MEVLKVTGVDIEHVEEGKSKSFDVSAGMVKPLNSSLFDEVATETTCPDFAGVVHVFYDDHQVVRIATSDMSETQTDIQDIPQRDSLIPSDSGLAHTDQHGRIDLGSVLTWEIKMETAEAHPDEQISNAQEIKIKAESSPQDGDQNVNKSGNHGYCETEALNTDVVMTDSGSTEFTPIIKTEPVDVDEEGTFEEHMEAENVTCHGAEIDTRPSRVTFNINTEHIQNVDKEIGNLPDFSQPDTVVCCGQESKPHSARVTFRIKTDPDDRSHDSESETDNNHDECHNTEFEIVQNERELHAVIKDFQAPETRVKQELGQPGLEVNAGYAAESSETETCYPEARLNTQYNYKSPEAVCGMNDIVKAEVNQFNHRDDRNETESESGSTQADLCDQNIVTMVVDMVSSDVMFRIKSEAMRFESLDDAQLDRVVSEITNTESSDITCSSGTSNKIEAKTVLKIKDKSDLDLKHLTSVNITDKLNLCSEFQPVVKLTRLPNLSTNFMETKHVIGRNAVNNACICTVCNMSFPFSDDLKFHSLQHITVYKCAVCEKVFVKQSAFKSHVRAHTSERPYSCSICNKAFTNHNTLKRHKFLHTGKKPFSCSVCDKAFTSKYKLKKHNVSHTGEKKYSCDICNKKFSQVSQRNMHIFVHTGERPYLCKVCNKDFKSSTALNSHQLLHTGKKPFPCDICKAAFTSNMKLRRHKLLHAGEKPKFTCDICQKGFVVESELKKHKYCHAKVKPYDCDICHKGFSVSINLAKHKMVHSGLKPFSCSTCLKAFSDSHDMRKHELRMHATEKPFQCTVCDKRFAINADRNKHVRICHNEDVRHRCTICNKSYNLKASLSRHIKNHRGERPFSCGICQKSFMSFSAVKRHSVTHTAEKTHSCSLCNKSFSSKGNLQRHGLSHSNEYSFPCELCHKKFKSQGSVNRHKKFKSCEKIV